MSTSEDEGQVRELIRMTMDETTMQKGVTNMRRSVWKRETGVPVPNPQIYKVIETDRETKEDILRYSVRIDTHAKRLEIRRVRVTTENTDFVRSVWLDLPVRKDIPDAVLNLVRQDYKGTWKIQ